MYEFIVLGLIPGTHVRVTFLLWAWIAGMFVVSVVMWRVHRLHVLRNSLVTLTVLMVTRRAPML